MKDKLDHLIPLLSGGHAPVVQRLLELPKGMIDFCAVNKEGKTGIDVAKEKGRSHVLWLLADAGHGDKEEVQEIIKSCGAKEFREACQGRNEFTVISNQLEIF